MAKIVIISFYFPPYNSVGAVRVGKIAEHLVALGHEVRVLTAENQDTPPTLHSSIINHQRIGTKWFDINGWVNGMIGGNKKTMAEIYHQGNQGKSLLRKCLTMLIALYKYIILRPDAHIGWYGPAVKQGHKICHEFKPDWIFASASPYTSLLIAKKLGQTHHIPYIADLRDLWADNHYKKGDFITRWMERWVLGSARYISSVSAPLVDILRQKYGDKVFLMQNGIDFDNITPIEPYIFDKDRVNIIYTGILYGDNRDPSPLFQAIANDKNLRGKIRVHFYGKHLQLAQICAQKYGLTPDEIIIHGEVSHSEAIARQKGADLLLMLTWNDPNAQGVLTGKLFEYMASGRPILWVGHRDSAAQLIADNQCGFGGQTSNEIARFLHEYLANPQKTTPNPQLIEKFDRRAQTQKLHEIFSP